MLSALGFLTVFGRGRTPNASTMGWFPIVGAGIGAVLALVHVGASELWAWPVVAALVVVADLVITGMLHVDGLADSADGLLPHLDRGRRLQVMSGPEVGAFALAVVPTVLLIRWATLGSMAEPWALVGVWALSRTVMVVVTASVPYARDRGLASAFLDGAHRWHVVWAVPAAAAVIAVDGWRGVAAVIAAVAMTVVVTAFARRRLGGFTGDVLGATAVLAETAALVALAAR